jgi:hypothetical protein
LAQSTKGVDCAARPDSKILNALPIEIFTKVQAHGYDRFRKEGQNNKKNVNPRA